MKTFPTPILSARWRFVYYLLLALVLTTGTALAQTIRYVKPSGTGNGTSWANTSGDLQGMINASASGDQVWVAAGTYKPTPGSDRSISFAMKNGVAIYGGFAGVSSETALSDRPAVNPITGQPSSSTLSGDIGAMDYGADNTYHVIKNNNGLNSTAVLDGFVITGGNANANSGTDVYGGGIFNFNGSNPTITNCSLQSNSATYGGAVINSHSAPRLTNCLLLNNQALNGGGIYNGSSNPVLTNCILQSNTANNGAGVFNDGSNPMLTNCILQSNTARGFGGAICSLPDGSPTMTNCTFQNNRANLGGVLYHQNSTARFINCSMQGNYADYGGAVCNSNNSTSLMNNCSLQGNSSPVGGAIYNRFNSTATIANCIVFDNGGNNSIATNSSNAMTATYSLFDVDATGYTGNNNLTTTSPFVSTTSLALNACTPAINAGNDAANTTPTDLAGNLRVFGGAIDMGAVEFQAAPNQPTTLTTQPAAASTVCAGRSVSVAVVAAGTGPFAYQWYKDGTSLGAAQTAASLNLTNVQTTDQGSYSVVVTGTCNSLTSNAFSLVVNALPTYASLTSGTLTCAQTSVTLTATATGGSSYTLLGGSAPQTNNTGQFIVSTVGSYTTLIANASGCTAIATASVVSNTAPPMASLSASSLSLCAGSSVTLTAGAGQSDGSATYAFSGPGLSQNTASPTAPASQDGTYSVIVTAGNGCTASAGVSLTLTPATTITASPASASAVCVGGAVSVSVGASGQSLTYQWYKGANPLNGQTSPVLSFAAVQLTDGGTYSVRVGGSCGPPQTSPFFTLTVNPPPAAPGLSASLRTVFSSASPLILTGFVTPTGNPLSFSGASGVLSNPPVATISQAGEQQFSVSQTNSNGCVSGATVFSLTVVASSSASQSVCRSSTVVLVSGAFGSRYEWYRNGQSLPFKLVEIASIQRGTASSSLTLVSVQTTASYYCKVFQGDGSFAFTGPFAVVINYNCLAPGARQAAMEKGSEAGLLVVLTPNPVVNGQLRAVVRGAEGQPLTVTLTNLQGQVVGQQVWEQAKAGQVMDWDVSQHPVGLYLLRAESGNRQQTLKVIHQ